MSGQRKSFRYEQKQNEQKKNTALRLKVLRSVLAVGFAMSPWLGVREAWAVDGLITRVDDTNNNLMQNGRADIFAESASGNVGLNRFEQFIVGNNDIANMYFRTKDNGTALDTLVNTVTNRIDIYGTVNALRDNKIGGNMYFLSPKGMIVGAGGVINAGSLTVMTSDKTFSNAASAASALKDGSWSLNPSASIDIHGTVNTATGIDLRAAYINVTKAPNAAQGPLLRTGLLFDTTVNNEQVTSVAVKEGRLQAKLDNKGNIVIADPNAADNDNLKGDGGIHLQASADSRNSVTEFLGLKAYDNTVTAKATVGEGAELDAVGNVDITSEAKLSNNTKFEQWWNFMGFTNAETTVAGSVSGANVNITSKADTNYSYGNFANMLDVLNEATKQGGIELNSKFTGMLWEQLEDNGALEGKAGEGAATVNKLLTQLYMPFNITDAKATTTISQTADITSKILKDADGKALTYTNSDGEVKAFTSSLNISANSTAKNKMKVKLQPRLKEGTTDLSKYFTGGFIYEDSSSNAIVNIDGKVAADGDINIEAAAENVNEAVLEIKQPKFYKSENPGQDEEYQGSMFMAGIGLVYQDTNAEVNVGANKKDTTITAGNDLNISASSDNSLSSEVAILANSSSVPEPTEDTALSTAINISGSKGNAVINNYGKLKGENIELNAEHTLSDLSISTSNDFDGEFTGVEWIVNSDQFKSTIDNVSIFSDFFGIKSQQAAGNNVQNPNAGGGGAAAQDPAWNQCFDVGAAITVTNVANNAKLNLKPTSEITATGDAALTAKINIEDTNIVTSDVIIAASENVKFGASAAVAVESMDNTAEINVESDADSQATLEAEGDVTLNASVEQRYTRFDNLINDVVEGWDDFLKHYTVLPDKKEIFDKLQNIIVDISKLKKEDKATSAKESKKVAGKAMAAYDLLTQLTQTTELASALEALFDASNYVNMYVASAAKGSSEEEIKDATLMASGSVGIQNLHNTANINLGANTKITADGKVDVAANVVENNVLFIGKQALKPTVDTTKNTEYGLGGSVGVQNAYNNSRVQVMNGVTISAGSIDIATNNDVYNLGLVYGGSQTSKLGITGMVSYMGGESNAKTLVDDDVYFTATKKVEQAEDGAEVSSTGAINIKAQNNANAINIVGALMQSQSSSVGVSTGVISYDVHTLAKVENQELDADGNSAETASTANKKGKLSANSVHVDAVTDGTINNITVAGSINSKTENTNAAAGGVNVAAGGGQAAAGNGGVAGAALNPNGQDDANVKLDAVGSVSWNYVVDETEAKLDNVDIELTTPEFGEGVQDKDMSTAVKVTAEDKSYIGAYSGAMALAKLGQTDTTKFQGSLAGAVAVNDLKKATQANMSNLSVSGAAADVVNSAVNSGVQVATGLSLGLETGKRGDGTSINLAASGSANYIDSTVQASMSDNKLTGIGMTVNNTAYDKDVQVAGGVTAEFAGATASVGAAVTINKAKNDIQAAMKNNVITAGSVNNLAASNLTQVGTAISVGVATGDKAYATLNVAVADNEVNNTVSAYVDGGSITAGNIAVEARDGKLSESESKNKYWDEINKLPGSLTDIDGEPETKNAYDLDGSEALKEANGAQGANVSTDVSGDADNEQANYNTTNIELTNKGNTIVGVALGLGVKTGDSGKLNGTGAAAAVINNVQNDFTAKVSNAALTTTKNSTAAAAAKVIAASDTRMVGVAAGIAASASGSEKPSLALAGSGVKQTIHNATTATVEDATIATDELNIKAVTASSLVSVAGQVSVDTSQRGVAGGLTWAENELHNTTGAYAKGLTLEGVNGSATSLALLADNQAKAIAVGVGAGGSLGYAAVEGAYASNNGTNNTEAVVDKSDDGKSNKLSNVKSVSVKANDSSVEKAVAGTLAATVGVRATATLGGAVSYNNIGNSANDKQRVAAKLNYADISTVENGNIDVLATNTADFLNLALGGAAKVGGDNFGLTAQGSVATTTIYADTYAGMEQTNINQEQAYNNAKLNLKAASKAKSVTSADALSVIVGDGVDIAAAGAVSVVRSDADTRTKIKNSKLKLQDMVAQAQSENEILDIAIGLGVGASLGQAGISAAANIVSNRIANDTTLDVADSVIDANGTAALLANSRELLRNYGGAISVGASGGVAGVALGVTVVTNTIEGNTTASVNNSAITAAGNGDGVQLTEHKVVNDGSKDEPADAVKNYQKHKVQDTEVTKKGLVVSADALHELRDISITAGVGASAAIGGAVDATVVFNNITGKTSAEVNNTDINKSLSNLAQADVFVNAYDKADISSHIGTLSVGAAGSVGVGAAGAGDRNTLSRETVAQIANANTKALNAHDAFVNALGETKLYISESGVGVGASGGASAAEAGSVSSDSLTGNTTALVTGVSGKLHSLNIDAERLAKVDTYNNAISVSAGYVSGSLSVGVTNIEDTSHTNAELSNAVLDADGAADSSVNVLANNYTELGTELSGDALAASIGGAAGISVLNANMESQVGTRLSNAVLGKSTAFGDVTIRSLNDVYSRYQNVAVGASLLLGVAVAKGSLNINTGTTSEVLNSEAYATNVITVSADEKRTIDSDMLGVGAGALNVGVNAMYTNIGTNLKDSYSYDTGADSGSTTGSYATDELQGYVNNALQRLNKQADLAKEKTGDDSIAQGSSTINKGHVNADGVKTTINKSILQAENNIAVAANAATNTDIDIRQASVGIVNVAVAANRVDVEDKLGVDIDDAVLVGKGIDISTLADGKIASYTGQGGVSGVAYMDTTGYIKHHGKNLISIDGSSIKATENSITLDAVNKIKLDNSGLGLNISGLAAGRLLLESEDASEVVIALGENGQQENTFDAAMVMASAQNAPNVRTENKAGVDAGLVAASGSLVVSKATGKATIDVTKQNTFRAKDTMLLAITGSNNKQTPDDESGSKNETTADEGNSKKEDAKEYTTEAINHSVGVALGSVTVDKARTVNNMEAAVNIGAAKFSDGEGYGNLIAGAINATASHSYITTTSVGLGVASSSNFAQSYSNNKVTLTLDTGADVLRVNDLDIFTSNKDYVETQANGSSAGLLSISPYLSKVENKISSTTTTTIKGNIIADGTITAQAARSDEYNLKSDSLTVTLGGGGTAGAENEITNNTELSLENANIISAGDVLLGVENTTLMNQKEDFAQMIRGSGMGVFNVERSVLDNTLVSNAQLKLDKVKILTEGDLQLISHNDEKLQLNGYVYSVSALGGAESVINNTITNSDEIRLQDSELKTLKAGKDITISAADDLKLYTYAYAETATGALAGANALLTNKLTRNNILDMSAGANNLYSTQDIKLYAGKNADGSLGLFDLNAVAADFIGATIPVAIMPSVKNTIQQSNQITLGADSASRSVRHMDIYAAQGREMANVYTNRYVGIYGNSEEGSFVTTDKGETINGKTADNFVKIDGSAVAGIANKIDIVIGDAGDVVILDKTLRDTVSGAKDKSDITVSVKADESTGLTKDSLIFGSEDYTSTLYKRYEEVNNLMIEYAKDGTDSAAYQGFKAEAERIKNEMLSMGLAELDTNGNIVPKASLSVDYVEIPELTGSGGNITVETDKLVGSGEVKAQGTPEINITNNTNLMTKINAIIVDDPGGKLVLNGKVVEGKNTAEFNSNINALNKGSGAAFSTVEAADGQSGKININGNYNGSSLSYKGSIYDDTEKKWVDVVGTIKPMANILIQGNIYSKEGVVSIKSAHDSILIQGKGAQDAVAISGATVVIDAANGNITQGYTDGIVNIGADVRSQYDQAYKDAISQGSGTHNIGQITTTIEDGSEGKGSYIAGGSVYINAADINVNGVIQSGFGDYYADISDQATQAAINRINNAYDGERVLSDAAVTTGEQYKIISGGAIWDAAEGCYKYRLNVYYNPSTKKILVQNVDAGGGRIYLTGRISSTGNGQIICLDGVSDINVKNTTQYDLQLGDLTTHDVSGLVSIQDTAKNTLTEITNGKVTVRNIDSKGQIGSITSSSSFNKDEGYSYNPLEGLKYSWTTGEESMNYKKYSKEVETGGWSIEWSPDETQEQLAYWSQHLTPDSTGTSANEKRPDGQTIRVDNANSGSTVSVKKENVGKPVETLDGVTKWSTGLWGYYRHTKMYWTKATGTRDTYDASIKADNPINVKFIGNEAKDAVINVSSNTSIEMTGNIGNTKLYETKNNDIITGREEKGTLNISSRDGSLLQSGGALYGENINLAAVKDIRDINIIAGDVVNLSAIQDATGKNMLEQNAINVTVNAGYLAKGNVVLGNMGSVVAETKDGKTSYKPLENSTGITGLVDITTTGSEGSISQQDSSVSIVADRINLTSNNGSIYGQKQADGSYTSLKLYAGQQPIGLDTLDASVNARAKGDISLEQTAGDLRIGQVISTDGDVSLTVAKGSVVDALPYVSNDRGDADDLVARWRSLGLIDGNEEMQAAKDKINAYADANSKGSQLGSYKAWDENALLYAIQDSIINQTSENLPKTSEKAPNVIGHNITLNVADSVGLNSGKQTRIDMTTLLAKDSEGNYLHLDELKALSKADASMVTWEDGGKTAVITAKLPIGVQQTTKTKVNADGTTTIINGSLTLKSAANAGMNGDIFLEGRDEKLDATLIAAATKDLYLGSVLTNIGDVTLSSLGGIYNNSTNSTELLITGSSLFMTAAEGSLGTADNKLTTNIFGQDKKQDGLNAVAAGGIYIDQKGDNNLILRSISSGGDIYLGADKSMLMGETSDAVAVSYVRAENTGTITLEARGGSLGEAAYDENGDLLRKENKGIRILNATDENGSKVTLRAQDNVFVTGIASADGKTAAASGAAGVLNLEIAATTEKQLQNVGIAVDGMLNLSGKVGSSETASIYTAADLHNNSNISSADTYLGSAKSIYVSGNEQSQLIGTDKLTLEAGDDVVSENSDLQSKELVINAGHDIKLKNVEIEADTAKLTAQNDITYHNEKSELSIGAGTEMIAKSILLQADAEGIIANGMLNAHTVTLTAAKAIEQTAGSIIAQNTIAKAGADLSLASATNKLQNVSVEAKNGSATIVSANDAAGDLNVTTVGVVGKDLSITNLANGDANAIKFDKNLQAGGTITITNEEADINVAEGTSMRAQNIALIAKNNDVNFNGGDVKASKKLSAEAKNIAVSGGELEAESAALNAGENVAVSGGTLKATTANINAGNNLTMSSGELNATTANLTAGNTLDQTAGSLIAQNTIAKAGKGGLFLRSESNKLQNVSVDAQKDSAIITSANDAAGDLHVTTVGEVGGNLEINNLQNGVANDIVIDNALKAKWNVIVNNKEADIKVVQGAEISGSSIYLDAKGDILHDAGNISADNKVKLVAGNAVMQTAGSIMAQDTVAKVGADLSLASATNKLQNVSVEAKNGSATIVSANDAAGDLHVTTVGVVGKDLRITNLANGEANAIVIDNTFKAKGNINVANKEAAINVVGSAAIAGANVTFEAKGDIVHNGGTITAGEKAAWETDGNILLQKGKLSAKNMDMLAVGYIDETYEKDDTATAENSYVLNVSDTLEVLAGGSNTVDGNNYGIDLGSHYNELHRVTMEADNGNIIIGNGGDADLELSVQSGKTVKGNIDIRNWQGGAANDVIVNGSLQAEGNIDIVNNEKNIIIKAPEGDFASGVVKGQEISFISAGSIENNNAITASDYVSLMAHSEIHNTGNINSGKNVLLTTEDGAIFNVGTTKAGGSVDIDAADYLINTGNLEAEDAVAIKAVDYLLNSGSIKAGADITATSTTSDLINSGNYYTNNGVIRMTAAEDILNLGVMETAKGNIEITTENGSIYNQQGADLLTGDGDIILHTKSKDATQYYYNDEGALLPVPVGAVVKVYEDKEKFGGQYITLDGTEYDVVKNGSVFNTGDALAMNGTIRFISDYGDVTNYDDFDTLSTAESGVFDTKYNGYSIATSNVEISAKHGTLFNSKDIEAGGDVTLTAAEGLTNFAYNVYAGKNIMLTATSGDLINSATLESYAGNVTLRAENGNVINGVEGLGKGDIITYGGNVTLSANGYGADGKAGSVTNYGDIIAINANAEDKAATGSITLISEHGDVDNFDDFNTYKQDGQYYKDYEAGKHQSIDSKDASYNLANNNLTLSAKEGHLYTDKDYLVALGNVTLEAKTGLESFGKTIYAGRDITLNATEGNLFNQAELLSVEGDIKLKAEKGTVVNLVGGDIIAKNGNVTLEAGAQADNALHYVDAVGNVHDLSTELTETADDNIIKSKQYYKDSAGEWVEIAKTNELEVVIPADAIEFKTEFYYLDAFDKDNRNKEVLLTTVSGDRSSGLAEAFRTGDVVNRGDIVAQGDAAKGKGAVTLHSEHGNVTNYDNFKLLENQNTYDYLGKTGGTHNIYVNGLLKEIKAKFNPDTPYAYDEKSILLSDSDMNIIAEEGYLYNNMNIVSDRDVNLTSGKTLTIGTNVGSVIANGNVVVRSLNGGVINDGHVESVEKNIILDGYTGVVSEVGAANLKALNGSISVVSIYGDINVDELFAGETAAAGTKQGNIKLGAISGKDVVLYTEDENSVIRGYDKNAADKEQDAAPLKVTVKDHLFLQGNHFGDIAIERSDNTGTLVVDANGVGGAMQGSLKMNVEGDVRFTKLNLTNADITVSGKLGIDRLHVAGKGIFTSQGYVTGVYGIAPVHDASNALYFDLGEGKEDGSMLKLKAEEFRAVREGEPEEVRALKTMRELRERLEEAGRAEETFGKDNSGWMNLYVDGPRDQRSNGLLLHIDTYYHSGNQRWSAEDLITKLVDFKPVMSYDAHFGDAYGLFERYNIIELPEEEETQV